MSTWSREQKKWKSHKNVKEKIKTTEQEQKRRKQKYIEWKVQIHIVYEYHQGVGG